MYGSENNVALLKLIAFFRNRGVTGEDIEDGFLGDDDGLQARKRGDLECSSAKQC
jgi:hypothetical protein